MTNTRSRVSLVVLANKQQQCTVRGCSSARDSLSPYCGPHYRRSQRHGHPTAAPVRATLWKPYRARIRALLEANAGHPGLVHALTFLRQWTDQAVALDGQRRQQWASEVARLVRHGVQPLDLLTELGSVWMALQDHPQATQSDLHRDFAISKAVLQLAPRPRRVTRAAALKGSAGYAPRPRASALKQIGPHLVQALAPLLANLRQSLETEEDRARVEAAAMRQPLAPSPAAVARAVAALPFTNPNP